MATYVEYRQKAYGKQLQKQASRYSTAPVQAGIRRPLAGIQMKPDTYAFIRVFKEDGTEIPLFGVDPRTTAPYSNFLVTQWEHSDMEKMQIVDTFGEDYLYFFGRKPRQYALAGYLLNTADFNWRGQWWRNYSEYLRGYKLAKMRARAYVYIDGAIIEGYFLNSSLPQDAGAINLVHFSTSMLVTNYVDTTSFYAPQGNVYEYPQGVPESINKNERLTKISSKAAKRGAVEKFRRAYREKGAVDGLPDTESMSRSQSILQYTNGPEHRTFVNDSVSEGGVL